MDRNTAAFWDERYRSREGDHDHGPAEFLRDNAALLPAGGRALDIGMGTGRNAVYLASLGFDVTGVDISKIACRRALTAADTAGVRLNAVCADIDEWPIPEEWFDVVLNFYFLKRDLCPRLAAGLRPGGVIVFETFTLDQRRFGWGPSQEAFLLRPGELQELFASLETLAYREGTVDSEHGPAAVASLVARRPA